MIGMVMILLKLLRMLMHPWNKELLTRTPMGMAYTYVRTSTVPTHNIYIYIYAVRGLVRCDFQKLKKRWRPRLLLGLLQPF